MDLYPLLRPAVFRIDPETAHNMTLKALKAGVVRTCSPRPNNDQLKQDLFGLSFDNPVGLAAGFDKNAEVIDPILKLGFGFAEVGTVTPRPQAGNPKPRLFRDPPNKAVINRLGFPNAGLETFKRNLLRAKRDRGLVGINIGMNKDTKEPSDDYCKLIEALAEHADYLTVNISSPNTPGLRDLQQKENLAPFLKKLTETRGKNGPAILVKFAPDLDEQQQQDISAAILDSDVDGIILTNTTLERPDILSADFAQEKGGLSGAPVREYSTHVIRNFHKLTDGKLPIIGVGGVSSADDAYEKIKAGASLIQLYTGMIYEGPNIANAINSSLNELLARDGFSTISEAIGSA